jgi:hypothetical protein
MLLLENAAITPFSPTSCKLVEAEPYLEEAVGSERILIAADARDLTQNPSQTITPLNSCMKATHALKITMVL